MNFPNKENTKMLISRKPCYIERFRQSSYPNFQKTFCVAKNGGHFEFFTKIAIHKNAYIAKTVLDRAISTKFLTHRVYSAE